MHPTQNPARATGTNNPADLVHQAKTVLVDYPNSDRAGYVAGYVRHHLTTLADSGHPIPAEIRASLAYLIALDELTAARNVDTYHREDPVDDAYTLPANIVGFPCGSRWAR